MSTLHLQGAFLFIEIPDLHSIFFQLILLPLTDRIMEKKKEEFINPINPDHITDIPHLLPYAHTVGGAIIRPMDKGRSKGLAMSAMYEQTDVQLLQIKEQVEMLIRQAQSVHDKINISERIYQADTGFKPRIGHIYHLYEKKDKSWVLSMIGPSEWGKNSPYTFLASVKLLSDHTWDILEKSSDFTTQHKEEVKTDKA